MAWYEHACFYHIYPLGLTGAPAVNPGGQSVPRLRQLAPWVDHIAALGCNALYIGPLFESGTHGYDTTDYLRLDRRLGENADLKWFVALCHEKGIRVVLDAVFHHTGRGFFAFRDLAQNREASPYRSWYSGVWFDGSGVMATGVRSITIPFDTLPLVTGANFGHVMEAGGTLVFVRAEYVAENRMTDARTRTLTFTDGRVFDIDNIIMIDGGIFDQMDF